MEPNPVVSLIMPVYNGMPYLPLAVESVLNQTFENFELIIVDDCSDESTKEYLRSIKDKRVILINNDRNLGVQLTLKRGINEAKGQFIARLDSDDISMSNRLENQLIFFNQHPDYGIIGTSYRSLNENGDILSVREENNDDVEVRWKMLFKSPFVHSTVMFRKSIIDQYNLNYDQEFAEDYDLWNRMLNYTKGYILKEPLVDYRIHNNSWTFTKKSNQVNARLELSFGLINNVLKVNGKTPISWNEYLEFINWRRLGVGDAILNSRLELNLLNSFCTLHSGNPLLPSLRKKNLNRIIKRIGIKQLLFNPKLGFMLLK